MQLVSLLLVAALCFVTTSSASSVALKKDKLPVQVILVRHGEKGDEPINLDPAGYKRADCLVDYFMNPKAQYNTPDVIYAMKQHNEDSGNRPVETVTPLATALNLTIIDSWKKGDEKDAAAEILSNYAGQTVLACWEHKALVDLALALGACTSSGASMDWGLNPESGSDDSNCYTALWKLDYPPKESEAEPQQQKHKQEHKHLRHLPRSSRSAPLHHYNVSFSVLAEFDVVQNGNDYECVYDHDPTEVYYQNYCDFKQ